MRNVHHPCVWIACLHQVKHLLVVSAASGGQISTMDLQPIVCAHSEYVQEENCEAAYDRISVEPTVQDVLCGRGKVRR